MLKPENRAVKIKTRQQHEEITAQQEIVITIEDNNERLYRQMRMLMQRNNELLDVIGEMQSEIDKLQNGNKLLLAPKNDEMDLGNGKYMRNGVVVVKQEGNTDFNFVQMRVSRLSNKRKQQKPTLVAQTKMLLELYNHTGEGMTPDELFTKSDLTKVTGYRYAKFFKLKGFLQFIGSNQNGLYEMTKLGRLFVEGRL